MSATRPLSCLAPIFLALLSGCGAATEKPAEPAASNLSPGQQCLADAGAPRTPGDKAPISIGVSQILIRHSELSRPQGASLSREEACLKALKALETVNASGDWDQTVQDFSDAGKTNGGDLGSVKRDEVTGAFGDAAFSLEVNELSYVVESDRGFHIILRTE